MKLRLSIAGLALAGALSVYIPATAATPNAVDETPMPSLAPMIKKVSPTVVGIATRGTIKERAQRNPLLEDPFFRRFFDMPDPQQPREREFEAAGSGVVVDAKNGYVITNAHVIKNATEITVTLDDNRELKAELVGADEGSDVAVIKLKQGSGLNAISLGDSSKIEVGDFVVAIGNPFGLQHTVTSGIISALGRPNINPDGYGDFIQTDASINPGNSGGALVNLRGELVGINTAIFSTSGGNIGIGFAIPANMVKSIMEQLIKYGKITRGVLGVMLSPAFTPDVAKGLGLDNAKGALISQVLPGSAAEKAGMKAGDVVVSLNGQPVSSASELRNAVGLLRIGEKAELGLIRDSKPLKLTAVITERTDSETNEAEEIHRGLQGAELADAENGAGVAVRSVEAQSRAALYGLRANDVIFEVNRKRIRNLKELREATQELGSFALSVKRGNQNLLLIVR